MGKVIDSIGQKFGRLTVIKREYPNDKWRHARWLCKCECGGEIIVSRNILKSGRTKSCGCLKLENARRIGKVKLSYGTANMRKIIRSYKNGAKRRGVDYELTEEQFKEITQKNCCYCGAKPSNSVNGHGNNGIYIYNGVDRIDSGKGYIMNNVVPCCRICNHAKNNLTLQEFQDWIKRIIKNNQNEEDRK